MVLRQRLEADPALANSTYKPPSPSLIKRALRIVEDAKEVSHPDSYWAVQMLPSQYTGVRTVPPPVRAPR